MKNTLICMYFISIILLSYFLLTHNYLSYIRFNRFVCICCRRCNHCFSGNMAGNSRFGIWGIEGDWVSGEVGIGSFRACVGGLCRFGLGIVFGLLCSSFDLFLKGRLFLHQIY